MNITIINSKIIVSDNPFSYTTTRSIYSTEERYKQTIDTINSVKKYIPNNFIIMIDNSDLNNEMKNYFIENVDIFINPYNNIYLKYDTDNNECKAISELSQIKFI